MINHIDITSTKKSYEPTDKLKKYIEKKFGKLDRRMARKNRAEARVDVKLAYAKTKSGEQFTCEAILHTPDYKLTAKETTSNMFASVDVVETKLLTQIKKHKETHSMSKDKKSQNRARRFFRRNRPE